MAMFELSTGFPACSDFTAAAVIRDPERLQAIRTAIESYDEEEVSLTRETLNVSLGNNTASRQDLSSAEFNAIMACLSNSKAATEAETTPKGYSAYTFKVSPVDAARVLDQQIVAAIAKPLVNPQNDTETDVQLVATLPTEIEQSLPPEVNRLNLSLRRLVMDASDTVRIANPYFDPKQRIIKDLAALPPRGVALCLLTREAHGDDAQNDTLDVVTEIVRELDGTAINKVSIRDFYETNRSGHQTGAVHAKVISVDNERCYIGSANLTRLNLRGNFELGVLLRGELVHDINTIFDAMFDRAETVPL